jgi:hypothetical protein
MIIRKPACGWLGCNEANLIRNDSIDPFDSGNPPQVDRKSLEMLTPSNYMFEQTLPMPFRLQGSGGESRKLSEWRLFRHALQPYL